MSANGKADTQTNKSFIKVLSKTFKGQLSDRFCSTLPWGWKFDPVSTVDFCEKKHKTTINSGAFDLKTYEIRATLIEVSPKLPFSTSSPPLQLSVLHLNKFFTRKLIVKKFGLWLLNSK